MKKNKNILLIILMLFAINYSYSQVTNTSHTYNAIPGDWVGWSSTSQTLDFGYGNGPLIIMKLDPTTGGLNLLDAGGSSVHTNSYQIGGYPVPPLVVASKRR